MVEASFHASWLAFVPETDRWLVSLVVAFVIAYVFAELFKKAKMSEMVGEILAGIVLGVPFVKVGLLCDESIAAIRSLGEIGILLLLALAGLEIELSKVRKASKDAVAIASLSLIVPFAIGYYYTLSLGYDWKGAFLVGIVLGVTAEEIATKVYLELDILDTRVGATTVLAAVVDDVIEVVALAMAIALITVGTLSELVTTFPIAVALFFVISYSLSHLVAKMMLMYKGDATGFFWLYLVLLLVFMSIGASLALGPVVGAILGGFFAQFGIRRAIAKEQRVEKIHEESVETLKKVLMAFLVPFFFLMIGLEFQVQSLFEYPVVLSIITAIAFAGKIGGTMLVKPLSKLRLRQLWFIGWGMNARGALGMILTLIALEYRLIGPELYTTIIAMAMITTIAFPFVVRAEYHRDPKIVD